MLNNQVSNFCSKIRSCEHSNLGEGEHVTVEAHAAKEGVLRQGPHFGNIPREDAVTLTESGVTSYHWEILSW